MIIPSTYRIYSSSLPYSRSCSCCTGKREPCCLPSTCRTWHSCPSCSRTRIHCCTGRLDSYCPPSTYHTQCSYPSYFQNYNCYINKPFLSPSIISYQPIKLISKRFKTKHLKYQRNSKEKLDLNFHIMLSHVRPNSSSAKFITKIFHAKASIRNYHIQYLYLSFIETKLLEIGYMILNVYNQNKLFEMASRKGWSQEEDTLLKQLHLHKEKQAAGEKLKWVEIGKQIQKQYGIERNGKQCRERWFHQINPKIVRLEWTDQEETLLFDLQNQLGNRWALIAEQMPGRTDNSVKNYFYSTIRKSFTKLNKFLFQHKKNPILKTIRQFKSEILSKLLSVSDNNYAKKLSIKNMEVSLAIQIKNMLIHIITNKSFEENQNQQYRSYMIEVAVKLHDFKKNCRRKKTKKCCSDPEDIQELEVQNEMKEEQGEQEDSKAQMMEEIFWKQIIKEEKVIKNPFKRFELQSEISQNRAESSLVSMATRESIDIELIRINSNHFENIFMDDLCPPQPSIFKRFSSYQEAEENYLKHDNQKLTNNTNDKTKNFMSMIPSLPANPFSCQLPEQMQFQFEYLPVEKNDILNRSTSFSIKPLTNIRYFDTNEMTFQECMLSQGRRKISSFFEKKMSQLQNDSAYQSNRSI